LFWQLKLEFVRRHLLNILFFQNKDKNKKKSKFKMANKKKLKTTNKKNK